MSDSDSSAPFSSAPLPSEDQFAARIQAEVAAAAERRRREDVAVARAEREIERVWADVAPPGAAGGTEELLLDRVERLSMIDVDAPIGERPGVKQVKGAIRKGTYWYLRYMSDQLNALNNVHARLLRRMDERLATVEAATGFDDRLGDLVAAAPAPGAGIGRAIVGELVEVDGPILVSSCADGACVAELAAGGVRAFGIDSDPRVVLSGIDAGLDLRVADGADELAAMEAGTLGAVVLGGELTRRPVSALVELFGRACVAAGPGGLVVIAPEAVAERTAVDAELLAGRGVSAAAWVRICQAADANVHLLDHDDAGIDAVVVARCP